MSDVDVPSPRPLVTPTLDDALLDRVVEFAERHREELPRPHDPHDPRDGYAWDQASWRALYGPSGESLTDGVGFVLPLGDVTDAVPHVCNTTLCLAGIAVHLSGGTWLDVLDMPETLLSEPEDEPLTREQGYEYLPTVRVDTAAAAERLGVPRGETVRITSPRVRAQRLLGLTDEEAAYLFDPGYGTVDELHERVEYVRGGSLR